MCLWTFQQSKKVTYHIKTWLADVDFEIFLTCKQSLYLTIYNSFKAEKEEGSLKQLGDSQEFSQELEKNIIEVIAKGWLILYRTETLQP